MYWRNHTLLSGSQLKKQIPYFGFFQIEAAFEMHNITNQETKYLYLVTSLKFVDRILSSGENQPYDVLKKTLVEEITMSKVQVMTKFLIKFEKSNQKRLTFMRVLQDSYTFEGSGRDPKTSHILQQFIYSLHFTFTPLTRLIVKHRQSSISSNWKKETQEIHE